MKNEIRVIIAGSRDFSDYDLLKRILAKRQQSLEDVTIISGTARGADRLGERFAMEHNLKLVRMPADWDRYGKRAGYLRNVAMAEYASGATGVLYAFWDGCSKGTQHMINVARKYGLEVHVIKCGLSGEGLESYGEEEIL